MPDSRSLNGETTETTVNGIEERLGGSLGEEAGFKKRMDSLYCVYRAYDTASDKVFTAYLAT